MSREIFIPSSFNANCNTSIVSGIFFTFSTYMSSSLPLTHSKNLAQPRSSCLTIILPPFSSHFKKASFGGGCGQSFSSFVTHFRILHPLSSMPTVSIAPCGQTIFDSGGKLVGQPSDLGGSMHLATLHDFSIPSFSFIVEILKTVFNPMLLHLFSIS